MRTAVSAQAHAGAADVKAAPAAVPNPKRFRRESLGVVQRWGKPATYAGRREFGDF